MNEFEIYFPFENRTTPAECYKCVEGYLDGFIWHRQPFDLVCDDSRESEGIGCLRGSADVGESGLDEWLLVFILVQITCTFNQCIASIRNGNEGQFLLAEIADHLPAWIDQLDEDEIDGRVWLYRGQLHLVSELSSLPDIMGGISTDQWKASNAAQECIKKQIAQFETIISEPHQYLHYGNVIVPRLVGCCLKRYPQLVSIALTAFEERLPNASIHSSERKNKMQFNSQTSHDAFDPESCIVLACAIPKHHYFDTWNSGGFSFPKNWLQIPQFCQIRENPKQYPLETRWLEVGARLTCGFEEIMLYQKTDSLFVREDVSSSYLSSAFPWNPKQLIAKVFKDSIQDEIMPGERNAEKFEREIEVYNKEFASKWLGYFDNLNWINVEKDKIDDILRERVGNPEAHVVTDEQDLKNLISRIQCVFNNSLETADYEGVDFDEFEMNATDSEADSVDEDMIKLMQMMDQEILGEASSKHGDAELITNLLKSFDSQIHGSGPVQTLLNSLGYGLETADGNGGFFSEISSDDDDSDN